MKPIKFRVRRKDGTLIGYELFKKGHWQCTLVAENPSTPMLGALSGDIKEQYIDQKDAAGTEIYENDRVMIAATRGRIEARVRWLNESDPSGSTYGFYAQNDTNPQVTVLLTKANCRSIEVVK